MDSDISPELEGEIVSSATQPEVEDPSYLKMMNSMHDRIGKISDTLNQWSIFRVPSRLREPNEDAYTPRVVSIGPIHSGQENLQAMEVHKTWYMQTILKRTKDNEKTLSACVRAILSIEEVARSCYYHYQTNVSNDKNLAEILLVDGCFILELFIKWTSFVNSDEISGDPIFSAGTICCLQHDLALLENQIPFFVLECLFNLLIVPRDPDSPKTEIPMPSSLKQLCASFFGLKLNSNQSSSIGCRHLLDLIRNCYLPRHFESDETDVAINCCVWSKPRTKQKPKKSWEVIHCVTKLRESGIKFVKGTSKNLFDIKFSLNGVLEIPELCMNDAMDSLLRNMIAFEQCCRTTGYHITSYAILMDCLIDSPGDAEFLHQKRIIENYLGHGEEVSNIFNKISKKVFVNDFFFAALCKEVNEYYNLCWPKKREIFVRDYYSSPWKFIGVVAGSILLLFAGLQTGYTMASYHYPPK